MIPSAAVFIFVTLLAAVGCSQQTNSTVGDGGTDGDPSADVAPVDAGADDGSGADANELITARPYGSRVPMGYDPAVQTPLVILLHGYGASGALQDAYFGLGRLAELRTFLFAYPDGTLDSSGRRFWSATDACCDLYGQGVDDVAYVNAIIDDVESRYNVDPRRVFLVGHSNGGFMAHRMACDAAPRIAAIVSLAGASWNDPARCAPSVPVAVLQVHGDLDATVLYGGGRFSAVAYPSAPGTVATWAQKNGCTGTLAATGATLDLDTGIVGAETHVEQFGGCPDPQGSVELWTIQGGGHIPALGANWAATIYDFLIAHPKPG